MMAPFTFWVSGNDTHPSRDRGVLDIDFLDDGTISQTSGAWDRGVPLNFAIEWLADILIRA